MQLLPVKVKLKIPTDLYKIHLLEKKKKETSNNG